LIHLNIQIEKFPFDVIQKIYKTIIQVQVTPGTKPKTQHEYTPLLKWLNCHIAEYLISNNMQLKHTKERSNYQAFIK